MRSVVIIAVAGAAILTGCSSADNTAVPPGSSAAPTGAPAAAAVAEPHTEAAVRAAAGEEFDAYASGDYGAAWDEWYAPAKKAISRTNYMRLFKLCPDLGNGVRFQIEKITMDNDHTARVRTSRLIAILTYQFVYESGHWRFVPEADSMHDYRTKTVEQMTKARRAQGGCGDH